MINQPEPLHHPEGVSIKKLIVGLLVVAGGSAAIGTLLVTFVLWLTGTG